MSEISIGFDFTTPVAGDQPGVIVTPEWTPLWDLHWNPVWTLVPVEESLEEGSIGDTDYYMEDGGV